MKRLLAWLLAGVMGLSLAACGNASQDSGETGQTAVSEEAGTNANAETAEASGEGAAEEETGEGESAAGAKLRVLNWGSTEEERIAGEAIARFQAANPGVEVEQTCVPVESWSDFIQKWITMITAGEAPDVINLGLEGARMAIANELLMPLDDIVASDEALTALKGQYSESLLEGFSADGVLYGLPGGAQTMVVYYNKDIFDEKGVEYPKDGWTWEEFKEKAEALTDGKVYGFGLSNSYFQLTPWWTTGGAYPVTEDYTAPALNTPEMLEAVTFLNELVTQKLTPDPISSDVYTMFSAGELAMVGAGRWVLNTWQDAGLKNFDCVQWPVNKEASSVFGGAAWAVGSTTQNKELAVALLKEMVSDETLKEVAAGGQQIPPTETLALDPAIMGTVPDNIDGLWKAITISKPVAAPVFFGDIEKSLIRALENVFSGSETPEEALQAAQEEVGNKIQ